ncbi:exotoxin A binding domain-containing protein [Iodobacter sp. CM08]|uniref:exotoxin A binding domain-containing protein n=1 Tax=Iodobacter sp. CM08 TaxID=3085902 RepID=UPI002981AFB2|nr:exotoxin A binding domain-containing protein [Iodobacter sp. CM08]MDW5418337.1 exotoxin A binding domain-containing protein [Iodobacter sp. CM08]
MMRFYKGFAIAAGLIPLLSGCVTEEARPSDAATAVTTVAEASFKQAASSIIKTDFEIFKQCTDSCMLSPPEPGKFISTSLPLQITPSPDEGVLYYSMFVQDRLASAANNSATIKIDDFAKIRINNGYDTNSAPGSLTIELATPDGQVKKFTHKRRTEWFTLNWAVPIGKDAPTSIKLFIMDIDSNKKIVDHSPLYSVDLNDAALARWPAQAKLAFSSANAMNDIILSWPGVGYAAAPMQHNRQKRWSEWHSGAVLCWLDPLAAIYNQVTQNRCNLSPWEGLQYKVVAGKPQINEFKPIAKAPIQHRVHFSKENALGALSAHRVCGIPLESLARSRQPRGWEEFSACGFQVENIVALYIATRLSFDRFRLVVEDLIHSRPVSGAENPEALEQLGSAVRETPELAREGLAEAETRLNAYRSNHPGSSADDAQRADVLSLTCPADSAPCNAPDATGAHVNREYHPGTDYFAPGEPVEFLANGTTRNWNQERLLATHQRLLDMGYVFAGYHGGSRIAARSIVTGGITHREQQLPGIWQGLYIAGDPEVAYGYAIDSDPPSGSRGLMMRVYVPGTAASQLFRTNQPLDNEAAALREMSRLLGRNITLADTLGYESITGPQALGDPDETVLGWDMAVHAVAIPSMIQGSNSMSKINVPDYEKKISTLPNYVTNDKTELK